MEFVEFPILANWITFKPISYVIRGVMAAGAFAAAMNVESPVSRVFGFVSLLLIGGFLLIAGFSHGAVLDILFGLCGLGAAGDSWWFTRS